MEAADRRRRPRPSFAEWKPAAVPAPEPGRWSRSRFGGLEPVRAAELLAQALSEGPRPLRDVTLRNKRVGMARILRDLAQRGLDLATVTADDCRDYHQYLRSLVRSRTYSEDYCSHLVRVWNSTLRAVFGFLEKPGQGLILKGFRQHARRVERLGSSDVEAMLGALDRVAFRWPHTREAFRTYLEVAWSSGARVGSLLGDNLRVGDVDLERGVLRLRHMKNVDHHDAVLSERAVRALRGWFDRLAVMPWWRGAATPVFVDPRGRPLTVKWVNESLKAAAVAAGVHKPVSTHVVRKSVGTLMGRDNPKLAQLQLGISEAVFNAHYNQPLLEDRLARRDLVPGGSPSPLAPPAPAGSRPPLPRPQVLVDERDETGYR